MKNGPFVDEDRTVEALSDIPCLQLQVITAWFMVILEIASQAEKEGIEPE